MISQSWEDIATSVQVLYHSQLKDLIAPSFAQGRLQRILDKFKKVTWFNAHYFWVLLKCRKRLRSAVTLFSQATSQKYKHTTNCTIMAYY